MRRLLPLLFALAFLLPGASAAPDARPTYVDVLLTGEGMTHGDIVTDTSSPGLFHATGRDYYDWTYGWDVLLRLNRTDAPGTYAGEGIGKVQARAWGHNNGRWVSTDSSISNEWQCAARFDGVEWPVSAEATVQMDGSFVLHATLGPAPPAIVESCTQHTDDSESGERTGPGSQIQPSLFHAQLRENEFSPNVTRIKLEGSGYYVEESMGESLSVPTRAEYARPYCMMGNRVFTGQSGVCEFQGTLRAHVVPDPCPRIREEFAKDLTALQGRSKLQKGASESQIRAWSVTVRPLIQAVLADERRWQLFGCEGELPGDALGEVSKAMEELRDSYAARANELSHQGVVDLLGAERAVQLTGGKESAIPIGDVVARAQALRNPSAASMTVSVHSPVSLHAYDENGGHVGWNATTNASESTIAGASYQGAPMGAQTLTLPPGFYRVVVEELGEGSYLLATRVNGTNMSEAFRVQSAPGRVTATHYALETPDDAPVWDVFPVQRGANETMRNFWPAPRAANAQPSPASHDDASETKPMPGGALVAFVGLAAVALALRRR